TKRAELGSDAAHADIADAIETLLPGEIRKLKKGGMRYSVLLNKDGGVMDDLMVTRPARDDMQGVLFLVVNAACKDASFNHIASKRKDRAELDIAGDRALIALQGPLAVNALQTVVPGVETQTFMTMKP